MEYEKTYESARLEIARLPPAFNRRFSKLGATVEQVSIKRAREGESVSLDLDVSFALHGNLRRGTIYDYAPEKKNLMGAVEKLVLPSK